MIAIITRDRFPSLRVADWFWRLTQTVSRLEQLACLWMQQLNGFTQEEMTTLPEPILISVTVPSAFKCSHELWMGRDVRGNCPGQREMETLITDFRKLWNNFIAHVRNIFNLIYAMSPVCVLSCYVFCLFCKGTLNTINQNKDIGLWVYCSFFSLFPLPAILGHRSTRADTSMSPFQASDIAP